MEYTALGLSARSFIFPKARLKSCQLIAICILHRVHQLDATRDFEHHDEDTLDKLKKNCSELFGVTLLSKLDPVRTKNGCHLYDWTCLATAT